MSLYGEDSRHNEEGTGHPYGQSDVIQESEPVYQDVSEIVKERRDGEQESQNMKCEIHLANTDPPRATLANTDNHNVPFAKTSDPKAAIEYGQITAKEVAKYRPCTQEICYR